MKTGGANGSQSVDRALALLNLVGRHADRGISLASLVEVAGLNKATTRRLLLALMRAGFVEQDAGTKRYHLGEGAYVLGSLAARRFGLLELSMDSLARISRHTEDTSFLSVRRDTHALCLHREEGTFPIRTHVLQAGDEHPLGCGAGALAILAALPDTEIEAVIDVNTPLLRERYPMLTPERLRAEVAATRERGFSVNPGLIVANSWAVGMVIRFPDGRPAGALSVAAIDSRMQEPRRAEIAACLKDEVKRIEDKLGKMFASAGEPQEPERSRRGRKTAA
ncbi:IclR family transcriptional regulator [Amorphus sp. 3PC139-8]|uniref:IclR family transcriptional regulator n=1 Tax=Amorphus sp. 3PC139-8 TaxID=2735676 RepID=UPI00345DBF51